MIRRFRALDMPLEDIGAVLASTDIARRNELIAGHLGRLEDSLARTQAATASLRELLQPPSPAGVTQLEHRSVPPTTAAAIRQLVDADDLSAWFPGAMGELHASLAAQRIVPAAPAGGIFATELFAHDRGEATVFLPCTEPVRATGRIELVTIPAAELAVIVHNGSHAEIDRAYGALATYVAEHALAVDGPVREYYPVSRHDTADDAKWRTEIGWPIFRTGVPGG